ncbi:aldose 1-epimerase family protein [Roseomonas xinghualingensis]|uniref:aldose 1-epimerase family protein n=1 Tax=Roseomonas xinghualingensis TaxID=2986475 RepID=UPI0021F21300|nr:aldose 1-epimerase family protein [Roseomonas sp. SXEYE001]MCV4206400.1 aldose 1-epimerase family protein [Roseomonas sp. SXEYE001]
MPDTHRFGDTALIVTVSEDGAELQSLRDAAGREWLWQAGPEWPRRAPILFPTVGRLPDDTLRHAGQPHRLTQHGFARDRRFAWIRREAISCALRLTDDSATRESYPFPFCLDVEWVVRDGTLSCNVTVSNPGATPLPFSLGAHPAFAWPLPGGSSWEGHTLSFPDLQASTLSARRLTGGLLDAVETIPLTDGTLPLHPELFAQDAIVLPDFPGHRIRYAAPSGASLEMEWEGYGDLGLWSKPGAAFLCLEPWSGTAAPLGWTGEFAEKPGVISLAPGASRAFLWKVQAEAP